MHRYGVYGVSLQSDIPLNYPQSPNTTTLTDVAIETFQGPSLRPLLDGVTPQSAGMWGEHALLPDGSTYLRWPGVAEFVLSGDGSRILCCADSSAAESWQT